MKDDVKKIGPLSFYVDEGYNVDKVAKAYIRGFNSAGCYEIEDYNVKQPTEKEIEAAKRFIHYDIEKIKGKYKVVIYDEATKRNIRKNIFVLHVKKFKKHSDMIGKLKKNIKIPKLEVEKDD